MMDFVLKIMDSVFKMGIAASTGSKTVIFC